MRRLLATGVGLAAGVWACAQVDLSPVLNESYKSLAERGVFKPKTPDDPAKRSLPPAKREGAKQEGFELHSAKKAQRKGQEIFAEGDVSFSFRGYDVTCDRAEGNLETEVFVLEGRVKLQGKDLDVKGERVQVNFKDESFGFIDGWARLGKEYVGQNLRGDLFVHGMAAGGTREKIDAQDVSVTTCDQEHPHFEFTAKRTNVRPGKRAILRDVRLKVLGKTILRLPYVAVPLEEYAERYVPEVGKTDEEGYYVKSRWTTPLRGDNFFDTRIDYFQKLGFGLGADFFLRSAENFFGIYRLYGITRGGRALQGSINHQQRFFGGILGFDATYQKNNYLTAPGTTLLSTRANYQLTDGRGNSTNIGYFRNSNASTTFKALQENWSIFDNRNWDSTWSTSLTVNMSSNQSTSFLPDEVTNTNRQLDLEFQSQKEFTWGSGTLEYRRTIPITQAADGQFFSTDDRTPMVTLRTDSARLFQDRWLGGFPFNAELSVGELGTSDGASRVTRTSLDLSFRREDRSRSRHQVSFGGRYKQGLYSDDTAQYVLNGDFRYRYQIARDSDFSLRYNYLRPYGFTPLFIDRSGKTNLISADLNYRPWNPLILRAQTAYDILQLDQQRTPWQRLNISTEYRPNDVLFMRTTHTYDTVSQVWTNQRLDFGWRVGEGIVSANAQYDGQRHSWGSLNLYVDGLKWGKLTTSFLLSYSGYNKQVQSRQVSFTYDLHCVEAILQVIDNPVGFRSGRQIAFFLRVKAFPFDTPFGLGQRGQAVGGNSGIRF
ncbi:MAG TPA: hypothetical protein PLH94_09555 [Fimbriimonadaceae bacterium]|nr:hypothetical protein [Fimbriimonadaceae bacterium]